MASTSKQKRVPIETKECCVCRNVKKVNQFYKASNPSTSSDGIYVNVCKNCIKKESINPDGTLNVEKFKNMLMLMDKAYVPSIIDSAILESNTAIKTGKGRKDVIGNYIKALNLSQNKLSFLESMAILNNGASITSNKVTPTMYRNQEKEEIYVRQVDDFVVTDEVLELFGEGYTKNDYRLMKQKFDKIKQNYSLQTNLHEEALATYVRFKVKEEQATAAGNVGEADKWNKAAQEAADKAKLTPKQLSQSDLQGGLSSVGEIAKAVEQATDIIEILPRFKFQPNDAVDFTIWCYINYARKLNGLPCVDYSDIYKFYDDKKREYIEQYGDPYGIFEDDPTPNLRDKVNKFITLPSDYYNSDTNGDENE